MTPGEFSCNARLALHSLLKREMSEFVPTIFKSSEILAEETALLGEKRYSRPQKR